MQEHYAEWIKVFYSDFARAFLQCKEATAFMQFVFPELRVVRGHVTRRDGVREPHWWTIAPDDSIVDPTLAQYPMGVAFYEPLVLDERGEPTGKCTECGELVYDGSAVCSPECRELFEKEWRRFSAECSALMSAKPRSRVRTGRDRNQAVPSRSVGDAQSSTS